MGFCLPFYGETAPPGTLACDGSEISREAYKELFQVLGTKAGAGDGSTTFNLPDLRGQFVRGTGGNAAALGTEQGDAIRNMDGSVSALYSADSRPTSMPTGVFYWADTNGQYTAQIYDSGNPGWVGLLFDASRVVPTAVENRPVNVALLWCIIYE